MKNKIIWPEKIRKKPLLHLSSLLILPALSLLPLISSPVAAAATPSSPHPVQPASVSADSAGNGSDFTAFAGQAGFELPDPSESYFGYQWALENNGDLRRTLSSPNPEYIEWGIGRDGSIRYRVRDNYEPGPGTTTINNTDASSGIDINVSPAWDVYASLPDRRSVIVAVIDTGIDISHPELTNSIWVNPNEIPGDGIDNDGNGYPDDIFGWNFYSGNNQIYFGPEDDHGTHAAGTIASAWDGKGTVGIADSAYVKIMPLKVLGSDEGKGSTTSVKEAIRYAEANGASICNLSAGTYTYDEELAAIIRDSSMLFVISSGNGDIFGTGYDIDQSPVYPAALPYDNIISVSNLLFDGSLDESSNFGAVGVDIAAPGAYILSTTSNNGYSFLSGTSMSAPMVTGVAALVYSCRPDLTLMDVREAILSSARKLSSLEGKTATGGMLDAHGAITYRLWQ